ncbi:heat-inducible transcriptional repressor HrcA [Candidatus Magnetobacterium casense]|uniref:Heat-inducible transcription repressor HrcA n=1 Tax=Candidatus Magnetobacterium casense TaxID=1455061 RepID=A0ABS6RYR6_9BACT|nr:heat-inducible transcriptional repressor HrcA [Candidatus Magnetobacterium casensis]MBV6341726.1 heat-inducible transcription repressor HrcA [Candidatus Magnetobacterium casensis]
MDARTRKILFAVIESYIGIAAPVGSRYISKRYGFGISSATIRNTMSDLEELGFLSQPYASAGRVPTGRAYRFFVESLLDCGMSENSNLLSMLYDKSTDSRASFDDFLSAISRLMSDCSHYMGVVLSRTAESSILRKIEFYTYKENMIVAILLTQYGIVRHMIVESSSRLTQKDMNEISRYLNDEFAGSTLRDIKKSLLENMAEEQEKCETLKEKANSLCNKVFSSINADIFISGVSELINLPDFDDIKKIKELSKAIDDKNMIINLLDKILQSEGVQVFVGDDPLLDEKALSLVASTFYEKGRPFGVLGLIGPQRMDYANAISIVSTSAAFLSRQLEHI